VRGKGVSWVSGGKAASFVKGKGSKLGEPCPKVKFSQDRMPIETFPRRIS